MIISHSNQACYWKIARTGSNTAELCIRMSNVLDLEQDLVTSCHFFPASHNVIERESGHTTPREAIKKGYLTQWQFDEYDHYTVVREPLERWISAYAYRCAVYILKKISPQEFFDDHGSDLVQRRQCDYLSHRIRTYPFSCYEDSIREIVTRMGGTLHDVPKIEHKTQRGVKGIARRAIVDTGLGEQLRSYYSDDLLLSY